MSQEELQALVMKSLRKHFGSPSVVEGPQGLTMPEPLARTIEALSKGLPKDCTFRRKAKVAAEFRLEEGERSDVSFVTTDDCDRDHEVVLPKGIRMKDYNNVVTFCHSYHQLPVGTCKWIKPQETKKGAGLVAKTFYPTKPADWGNEPWLPSAVLHLMQQETPVCTGKSIGFIPLEMREPTKRELEQRPDWEGVRIISQCSLLEYAVAPIPCNYASEMMTVSKSLSDPVMTALVQNAMKTWAPKDAPPVEYSLDGYMTPAQYLKQMQLQRDILKDAVKHAVKEQVLESLQRMLGVV